VDVSVGDPSSAGLEALSVLRAAAEPAAGPLAGELAARALRVTERADFTAAQDALHALLRRHAAARGAGAILSGPRRRALGWYRVGRRERGAPHHHVLLVSLEPIEGSCSCPDFASASLGICAHLFLVAGSDGERSAAVERPALRWDPVRPLTGTGDWLERLFWCDGPTTLTPRESRVRRLFRASDGERSALPAGLVADPRARLSAVAALIELVGGRARLAEPAILPLLERDRQELTRRARGAIAPREIRRYLEALEHKLLLYQGEGVRRFLERGRLLLADDMGLGKTVQAAAACRVLVASGRVRRGLIVVPASLDRQWRREWPRFTDVPLEVFEGRLRDRARTASRRGPAMLLVREEQLGRHLTQLVRFRPAIVVVDEPQRMRAGAAGVATHLAPLDARWRLVLTGGPVENRLDELAPLIDWIDESALQPRWRLASWHARRDGERSATAGARNGETLRLRLAPSVMRRTRRDVIEQLPARRDTVIATGLMPAQRTVHDQLDAPIARLAGKGAQGPLSQTELESLLSLLGRQRIACNGMAQVDFPDVWPSIERRAPSGALLDSLASPKLGELRELVSAIAITQARKVVVFSQWQRMLRLAAWAVSDLLRATGVRTVFLAGEESSRQRTQKVAAFRDQADVRVLFATDAAGVGLDLRRAASSCIHLDMPWNPAVLEQRTRWIGRPGQERPVDTWALVAEDGIEGRIAALIGHEPAHFADVFDGTSDAVELDRAGSFLSRLESVLPRPALENDCALDAPERLLPAIPDAGADDVPASAPAANPAPADGVASLVRQIQVTRRSDGRISLEAPAGVAAAVAELLHDVARLFSDESA
jgi:hypothetical protein